MVRVIGEDSSDLGVMPIEKAQELAREHGLDVFKIRPEANPQIVRLINYGTHKFEQDKKLRQARRKYNIADVKEIKMRYEIDDHDYRIKLKSAMEFLDDGDKVKILTMLRSRELEHKDLALALQQKFADDLRERASIEKKPSLEGKSIIMVLSPVQLR